MTSPGPPFDTARETLKRVLRRFFPGFYTFCVAGRRLRAHRPAHFRPVRSFFTRPPAPLEDRPAAEIESINRSSRSYFEQEGNREFWLNRPFSYAPSAMRDLWRVSFLLSALQLGPDDEVLDFGCGSGWTCVLMAKLGVHVVGMDIAPRALELARETAERDLASAGRERVRFELYDGHRIPAADGRFDAVVVSDAFHHLPNPRTALDEFHRVLAPDGRLAFAEPGLGHSHTQPSLSEKQHGILEEDLDIERLYRTATAAGFRELRLLVPPLEPETLTLSMDEARRYLRGRSWLVPADYVRAALLLGPMGVFSKGRYEVTSLRPAALRAGIAPGRTFVAVAAGEPFSLDVTVRNVAETVWLAEGRKGRGQVKLGAHLLDASGRMLDLDYGRAGLPGDLPQGGRQALTLRAVAPESPGDYTLRLDMVDEGVCWFEQRGSPVADVSLSVGPRLATARTG